MSHGAHQPRREPLSLRMTRTPSPLLRLFGVWAAFITLATVFVVATPWTQSVTGKGQVTVFSPMERPQTLSAEIDGRLVTWRVKEGDLVEPGAVMAELAESKPEYLDPGMLDRVRGQRDAARLKRDAVRAQLKGYDSLLTALRHIGRAGLHSEGLRGLAQSEGIGESERRLLAAEQQSVAAARQNLERMETLHASGIRSARDLEVARREFAKAEGDVESKLMEAELKRAVALEKLGGLDSDLLKAETELAKLYRRGEQRLVRSPVGGRVVRVYGVGAGHVFKAGDPMVVVSPDSADQAVELLLDDDDAPLVSPGREVRLQFSGWPAIQLSGWPSVAAGTFAGRVAVVDAVGDGRGYVRALVRPDFEAVASGRDESWPAPSTLRAGTSVMGWVLLDRVPLWFELWRRFNAFPPSLQAPQGGGKEAPR
jgi:adhesin transport system membrane fusion protein